MSTIPRLGVNQSVEAPGLAIIPPVSGGARKADDLLSALRALGGTAAAAGAVAEERAREGRRLAAEHKQTVAGAGSLAARTMLPGALDQIGQRKTLVPDGVPITDYAESIIREHVEGVDPEYAAAYREVALPHLVSAFTAQQAAIRDEALDESLKLLGERAISAPNAEVMKLALAEAHKLAPYITDSYALGRVIVPAMRTAAESGDTARLEAAASVLGQHFPEEQTKFRARYEAALQARAAQTERAAVDGIYALADSGAPFQTVREAIAAQSGKAIDFTTAAQLDRHFLTSAQAQTEDALRTRVLSGTISVPELEAVVVKAATLGRDNPNFIDPTAGQSILDAAKHRDKFDLAKAQVGQVLSGGAGNLTESQHSSAFTALVGPEGAGYIDASNTIAKPGELTTSLLRGRIMPPAISQTILANLNGGGNGAVGAAEVVGALGNASPRLYAKLLDDAGPTGRAMLDAASEQWQRGRLQNQATAGAAVQAITAARDVVQEVPAITPEVIADVKRSSAGFFKSGDNALQSHADAAVSAVRATLPHTKDSFFFDWLDPDPSLALTDANVNRRVQGWWASRFAELRTRLPKEQAMAKADEYAQAKVRNSVDFVRWDGTVSPVLIDVGQGLRMPEAFRWGAGFEDEARADLKAAGFKPDDVATLRPFLTATSKPGVDPMASVGWSYVTKDGDPLVDDKGHLVIFRPADPTIAANAKLRAELDRRETDFRLMRSGQLAAGVGPALTALSASTFAPRSALLSPMPSGPFFPK